LIQLFTANEAAFIYGFFDPAIGRKASNTAALNAVASDLLEHWSRAINEDSRFGNLFRGWIFRVVRENNRICPGIWTTAYKNGGQNYQDRKSSKQIRFSSAGVDWM
jgi:hypothetical protein